MRLRDSFFTQHLIVMPICPANNTERRTIIIIPECAAGEVFKIERHQSSPDGRFMCRVLMTLPSCNSGRSYHHEIIEKPTIVAKRQIVQIHRGLNRLSFLYEQCVDISIRPMYRVKLPFINFEYLIGTQESYQYNIGICTN